MNAKLPATTPGAGQVIFHDPLAGTADVEPQHHRGRTARRTPRRFDSKRITRESQARAKAAAKVEVSRDLARLIAEHTARTESRPCDIRARTRDGRPGSG